MGADVKFRRKRKRAEAIRRAAPLAKRWPQSSMPGRIASSTTDGRIVVEVEVMGRSVPFQV
jgi:hypothetical protein